MSTTRTALRIARNTHQSYGTRGTIRLVRAAIERRDVLSDPRRIQR